MNKAMLILFSLSLFGCASVHDEIVIEASPKEVWSVLTDTASYPIWNPVIVAANGEFGEGSRITMQFMEVSGKQYQVEAEVKQVVKEDTLKQQGGYWGIMTFDHTYKLEQLEEGTKVTIHEDYTGVYVLFWDHKPVEASYVELNKALRNRVLELRDLSN